MDEPSLNQLTTAFIRKATANTMSPSVHEVTETAEVPVAEDPVAGFPTHDHPRPDVQD